MEMPSAPAMWTCEKCGKKNKPISKTCADCGAPKESGKAGSQPAAGKDQ